MSIEYNDSFDLAVRIIPRQRTTQANEEDRFACHCVHIDRATERNGQPRLEIEAIEGIDNSQVVTARGAFAAVRERQVDVQTSILARIGDGEQIARKGTFGRSIQTKADLDTLTHVKIPDSHLSKNVTPFLFENMALCRLKEVARYAHTGGSRMRAALVEVYLQHRR
jgi:hypothetical protein